MRALEKNNSIVDQIKRYSNELLTGSHSKELSEVLSRIEIMLKNITPEQVARFAEIGTAIQENRFLERIILNAADNAIIQLTLRSIRMSLLCSIHEKNCENGSVNFPLVFRSWLKTKN